MSTPEPSPTPGDAERGSLRDWFAGIALGGMIPAPTRPGVLTPSMDGMAVIAYEYADSMLRARQLPTKAR
jgi:hypothetical protein